MPQDLLEQLLDWFRSRYFGKYRGTVTDNDDPTGRGRLKVRVPSVLGDLEVWAMPCVPYAGAGVGFYSLPEDETGVWVEFEAGDPSYPIWSGFFWADGELPDKSDANIKVWKTEQLTLRIDDSAKEVLVESASGAKLTLNAEIESKTANVTHTVSRSGVESEAGMGKVEVGRTSVKINNGALEVT